MAHHAEVLTVQRERHKQLTWKANMEVSSWLSEVKISSWLPTPISLDSSSESDGISAIAIPCGPPVKTFKVLTLSNQQQSGLREETRYVGYFTGSFFTAYIVVRYCPSSLYTLTKTNNMWDG